MNKYSLYLSIIMLALSCSVSASADTHPEVAFNEANALYREGKFEDAQNIYHRLIYDEDFRTPEVFYNLANTYIKLQELGPAVLNYERALMLDPRDNSIAENLRFAKSLIVQSVEDERNWYVRATDIYLSKITAQELTVYTLSVYFIFLMFYFLTLIFDNKKILRKCSVVLFFLAGVFFLSLIVKQLPAFTPRSAIIISNTSEVRFGPSESDKVAFRLSPGIEVRIAEKRNEWSKIYLVNGSEGWIKNTALEEINLR